jgi:hypothetical protein
MPITNLDRSGYFGASDTSTMLRNWDTKTFKDWWLVKLGIIENPLLDNKYIRAGNLLEIPILRSLNIPDMQFGTDPFYGEAYIARKLRINLDGYTEDTIYEVKCIERTRASKYRTKIPLEYERQCQVQMFGTGKRKCNLVVYSMSPHEYEEDFLMFSDINPDKIMIRPIEYSEKFILEEYAPVLEYLTDCLEREMVPDPSKRRSL